MFKNITILVLSAFILISCSKKNEVAKIVVEPTDKELVSSIYAEALSALKAGDAFYQNPMDTPFIPTWSRVKSAIPDFLIRLEKAVNEDNMRYI